MEASGFAVGRRPAGELPPGWQQIDPVEVALPDVWGRLHLWRTSRRTQDLPRDLEEGPPVWWVVTTIIRDSRVGTRLQVSTDVLTRQEGVFNLGIEETSKWRDFQLDVVVWIVGIGRERDVAEKGLQSVHPLPQNAPEVSVRGTQKGPRNWNKWGNELVDGLVAASEVRL